MKKSKALILILIAILVTISVTQIAYSKYRNLSSKYIPAYVEVRQGNVIGLNTRTDALYFGIIPPGNSGERFLDVTNDHKVPARVQISFSGDISAWASVSSSDFVLQPKESMQISAVINIPGDAKQGNYTGAMFVILKRN